MPTNAPDFAEIGCTNSRRKNLCRRRCAFDYQQMRAARAVKHERGINRPTLDILSAHRGTVLGIRKTKSIEKLRNDIPRKLSQEERNLSTR